MSYPVNVLGELAPEALASESAFRAGLADPRMRAELRAMIDGLQPETRASLYDAIGCSSSSSVAGKAALAAGVGAIVGALLVVALR